uniref:Uncharacterized protein n=1 Tax=viral metagenome TaxID=1070528 RepID=A0A6M3KKD6_9ZZZZ
MHRPITHRLEQDLADLRSIGHFPVRGGAEADDDAATATIEVNGEQVSRQAWDDFRNDQNWRRSNEERSATLKRQQEELEHERSLLREEQRRIAAERANEAETRGKKDEKKELPDYPESPIDEPDKLLVAMRAREAQQTEEIEALKQAIGELRNQVTNTEKSVDAKVSRTRDEERVVTHNNNLFESFRDKHPDLSKKELDEIREEVQYRSRGPGRGRQVGSMYEYNDRAFDDAYKVVCFDRIKAQLEQEAENRGLRNRRNGNTHGGFRLGVAGVPGPDATIEEHAEHYYTLGEYSPRASAFIEELGRVKGPDYIQKMMEYAVDRAQEELGGELA